MPEGASEWPLLELGQLISCSPCFSASRFALPAVLNLGNKKGCLGLKVVYARKIYGAGWDAARAKWFGYPTAWVNRPNSSPELGISVTPDVTCCDLSGLVAFVTDAAKS